MRWRKKSIKFSLSTFIKKVSPFLEFIRANRTKPWEGHPRGQDPPFWHIPLEEIPDAVYLYCLPLMAKKHIFFLVWEMHEWSLIDNCWGWPTGQSHFLKMLPHHYAFLIILPIFRTGNQAICSLFIRPTYFLAAQRTGAVQWPSGQHNLSRILLESIVALPFVRGFSKVPAKCPHYWGKWSWFRVVCWYDLLKCLCFLCLWVFLD